MTWEPPQNGQSKYNFKTIAVQSIAAQVSFAGTSGHRDTCPAAHCSIYIISVPAAAPPERTASRAYDMTINQQRQFASP
jgi:hypothetical protein